MDCREAEEQLSPYLLGALGSMELYALDRHIEACTRCSRRLHEEGEIIADLAYGVPQLEVPIHVKRRLMSRIEAEADLSSKSIGFLPGFVLELGSRFRSHSGMAVASIMVLVVVLGGVWVNERLNEIADRKEAQAAQTEPMTETNAGLQDQLYLAYSAAAPGLAVEELSATRRSDNARGMFLVPRSGNTAFVAALGLLPLPRDLVYHVWLVMDGRRHSAGSFTVDSTGYGYVNIKLFVPLRKLDAIVVTVERAGGSDKAERRNADTGRTVLRGDL